MSCTRALFQKPITGTTASRILKSARNGRSGLPVQVTNNTTRTISSFSNTNTTVHNQRNNNTTLRQQQQQQQQYHSHTIHSSETATNRFGAAQNNNNNILRRSMVTITQTKSSDVPPLFMDDVSSSSSSQSPSAAPTYVVNEDTNLIVTESCLKQVEQLLIQRRARADQQPENHDDGYFLRCFVDAGGCSGFQYQFEVDNEIDDDEDVVVVMAKLVPENNNDGNGNGNGNGNATIMRPRVVVDETSMGFLEGSTIDYVIEMIKSAFVVSDNPQSESACGCGSSFAMKNFDKFGAND